MRRLLLLIATFAVALLLGIGSAWYMIERGTPLTTNRVGPWASWMSEGNPNADPYTKAHLARSGRLPLTSTTARYFFARTDSEGDELTSACEYSIEGSALDARWWSIAVYDAHGSVIENPSQRYSFNSDEAIRRSDGTYHISLASHARPENWLPSGSKTEQALVLMLRIYGPRETDSSGIGQIPNDRLPKIERKACS
ncbi:MAG: DUF1214 domain-containing protein [Methyloceanibacter sp.]